MSTQLPEKSVNGAPPVTQRALAYESALVAGDLSKLSAVERGEYYNAVCNSLGLNPLTKPFEYINLNGKLTLYAARACTDQLRKIHGVSLQVVARESIGDLYSVSVRATDKEGRTDEATGVVTVAGFKGDNLANALMKAETKAKRRATLSICGLGWLDESEIETIPGARLQVETPTVPTPSLEQGGVRPAITQADVDELSGATLRRASLDKGQRAQEKMDPTDKSLWRLFFSLKERGHDWPRVQKEIQLENIKDVAKRITGDTSVSMLTVSTAIKLVEELGLGALERQSESGSEADDAAVDFDEDDIPY